MDDGGVYVFVLVVLYVGITWLWFEHSNRSGGR